LKLNIGHLEELIKNLKTQTGINSE